MTSTIRPSKTLISILAIFLFCFVCFMAAPFPVLYRTDTFNYPEDITSVWPPPNNQIWRGYYMLSGITVKLTVTKNLLYEEYFPPAQIKLSLTPFLDRVYLFVDGIRISNQQRIIRSSNTATLLWQPTPNKSENRVYVYPGEILTWYSLNWEAPLSVGKHTARFVVEVTSGKTFEYEWDFTIR